MGWAGLYSPDTPGLVWINNGPLSNFMISTFGHTYVRFIMCAIYWLFILLLDRVVIQHPASPYYPCWDLVREVSVSDFTRLCVCGGDRHRLVDTLISIRYAFGELWSFIAPLCCQVSHLRIGFKETAHLKLVFFFPITAFPCLLVYYFTMTFLPSRM